MGNVPSLNSRKNDDQASRRRLSALQIKVKAEKVYSHPSEALTGEVAVRWVGILFSVLLPAGGPHCSFSHLGPGRAAQAFLTAAQYRASIQGNGLFGGSEAFGAQTRVRASGGEQTV